MTEDQDNRFWLGKQKAGKTLTIKQTMTVFCAWLCAERVVIRTSQMTGVTQRTISTMVKKGNAVRGVPPFGELANMYEASGLIHVPLAHDESIKNYKWSRRKAVAQHLQICEGLRQGIRDAVLSGELKIKTPEDAAKMAKAVKDLEESFTAVGRAMDLVVDEPPAITDSVRDDAPDFEAMGIEELKAWTQEARRKVAEAERDVLQMPGKKGVA